MPYDRFIERQLAADLLDEHDSRNLAALGLLTTGNNLTARDRCAVENLDDRIDVVTRGLLGLSVACARCHDHRYDPIHGEGLLRALYSVFLNSPEKIKRRRSSRSTPRGSIGSTCKNSKCCGGRSTSFGRSGLEEHKADFREEESLAKYIAAAREGRDFSNTQLEKLAREQDLNLYLLRRWRAYLDSVPFDGLPAEELAQKLSAADRPEPWADRARERLRQALWRDRRSDQRAFRGFLVGAD